MSISSSMTKNDTDTWELKLQRKYTNVLLCVTNLFLPLFLSRIADQYKADKPTGLVCVHVKRVFFRVIS